MIEVGVRELKNDLSAYLRRVARGEHVRVTVRGRPVADLLPTGSSQGDDDLRRLALDGAVTLAARPKPRTAPPLVELGRPLSDEIIAGREEER